MNKPLYPCDENSIYDKKHSSRNTLPKQFKPAVHHVPSIYVYHGSNSNFKELKISKSLVQRESTLKNEGLGIYFSIKENIAKEYGKYLYTLQINPDYFVDFRNLKNCMAYVHYVFEIVYILTKTDIRQYCGNTDFAKNMYLGGLAISGLGAEIIEHLDNNEKFYHAFSNTKREDIFRALRKIDRCCPKVYMFNYSIKDIGIIKDVDERIVKIAYKDIV